MCVGGGDTGNNKLHPQVLAGQTFSQGRLPQGGKEGELKTREQIQIGCLVSEKKKKKKKKGKGYGGFQERKRVTSGGGVNKVPEDYYGPLAINF